MDPASGSENRWKEPALHLAVADDGRDPAHGPLLKMNRANRDRKGSVLPDPPEPPSENPVAGNPPRLTLSSLAMANSWLISLFVHLVLLILLSILTYQLRSGTELNLQLANSPADDAELTLDSDNDSQANEGNELDQELEQLLAASDTSATFEINAESFEFDPAISMTQDEGIDDRTSDSTRSIIQSKRRVGNGNQAEFFGIQASGRSFVFIVDSSSSMAGRRWKNAVHELRRSLEDLDDNQIFYVIFFDHRTHLMFQGVVDKYLKSRSLKMLHATEENLVRVNKWLGRIDLGSQTRPRISFDYGFSLKPDAIFFLTDGEFSDGTYEYLMGIAAQNSKVTPIHTVAFGNPIAGKTLERIADKFKGKYRFVR